MDLLLDCEMFRNGHLRLKRVPLEVDYGVVLVVHDSVGKFLVSNCGQNSEDSDSHVEHLPSTSRNDYAVKLGA